MRSTHQSPMAHDNHPHGDPDGLHRQHTATADRRRPHGRNRSGRDGSRTPRQGGKHDGERNHRTTQVPAGHSRRRT